MLRFVSNLFVSFHSVLAACCVRTCLFSTSVSVSSSMFSLYPFIPVHIPMLIFPIFS